MADQDADGESLEVNWQLDSLTIDATLVRPIGPGPFAGVVMVAGSGPPTATGILHFCPVPMAAPA